MNAPSFCDPRAYQLFAESLPHLESTSGLVQAATAIALHAIDDFDPDEVERTFDALADRVGSRARPEAVLAHLHRVLYDEEGFQGEHADYYNPLNSYLPSVLRSRRGIPITLALIYKAVGERVGLEIDGINAPGHFLLRVRDSQGTLLVDPFHRGKVLTDAEAHAMIDKVFGRQIARTYDLGAPAQHWQWVQRMLVNLKSTLVRWGSRMDSGAISELQELLGASVLQRRGRVLPAPSRK